MVFRNGGPLRQYEHWTYKGDRVDVVSFYKYLGAYFTPKLSWTMTKETLAKQATKALACIYACQKHFGYFTPQQAFKLFDAMILPISRSMGVPVCRKTLSVLIFGIVNVFDVLISLCQTSSRLVNVDAYRSPLHIT